MKTILLAIVIIAIFTVNVNAQNNTSSNNVPGKMIPDVDTVKAINKFKFSIGLEEGIPANRVSRYAAFVTGGSLQVGYTLVRNLDLTLNAGYIYFLATDGEKGLSFVPVMAGVRYNFLPKFYLSGQLGASAYTGSDSEKDLYLTYAQGIGFKASKQIDILAKFQGINVGPSKNYSFAGLRIAYTFGKGK
jgi:hypothetical protein